MNSTHSARAIAPAIGRPSATASRLAALAVLCFLLPLAATAVQPTFEDDAYSRRGADDCLRCHRDDLSLAIFKTKHGVPGDSDSPFGHGQLQCEACHGPGAAHAKRPPRGEERAPIINFGSHEDTPVAVQNAMCVDCHANDTGFAWHGSAHDFNEVACADCHSSHAPRDPVLMTASQPEVCYECHVLQAASSHKPFNHPLDEGAMDCGACHNPHGSTTDDLLVRQTLNQTCYQCHADKRGPFLWEHAPVAEDCSLCHAPHGSNHPGMLTVRGPFLCQTCHSAAGHPSVSLGPDALEAGSGQQRFLLGQNCLNCHSQVHGSNHPSGSKLMR